MKSTDLEIGNKDNSTSPAEKIIDFLKRNLIGSFISFIVIFVPLLGILNAAAYYYFFDIRIVDYLSFYESALLFSDRIIDHIIFIAVFVLAEVYMFNYCIKVHLTRVIIQKHGYLLLLLYFLSILNLSIYKVYAYNDFSGQFILFDKRGHFYFLLSSFIFYLGLPCIYLVAVKFYRIPILFFTDRIIPLIVIILVCTFLKNRGRSQTIWNLPDEQDQFALEMDDNTKIKTGEDTVYLGRTASAIFFLIRPDSTKLIINSDKIKVIHVLPRKKEPHYCHLYPVFSKEK